MSKAKSRDEDTATQLQSDDAATDVVTSSATPAEAARSPKVVLDGVEYDASHLSDTAKGIISSLQFSEARLMALHNELAACQTAYAAYLNSLKSELVNEAG